MRKIAFEKSAFEEFTAWAATDKRIYQRIVALIADILREPFSGLGKPEPLRHQMQGYCLVVSTASIGWSTRSIRMR